MDFSSFKGLLYIIIQNHLISALSRCRTEKIWGKTRLNPKSLTCDSRNQEDKLEIMNCNLYADSMKQSRHNFFEQNHLLMKISAKSVAQWARLPSKASITREIKETESVPMLYSMVNKNNQQHVNLVSLGQRRKLLLSVCMSGCAFFYFHQMSGSAVRDCSLLKRMIFWNRSKHSSAQEGSLPAPFQILTNQPQRQPFCEASLK